MRAHLTFLTALVASVAFVSGCEKRLPEAPPAATAGMVGFQGEGLDGPFGTAEFFEPTTEVPMPKVHVEMDGMTPGRHAVRLFEADGCDELDPANARQHSTFIGYLPVNISGEGELVAPIERPMKSEAALSDYTLLIVDGSTEPGDPILACGEISGSNGRPMGWL